MSGTGRGRQLPGAGEVPTPAEQHLGDRLAALVDGELGHDARERVLAHLATCWSCKAEADAQRRLKNVFADAAPPPPSDGLLARLQGLPAGDPGDPGDGDGGRGPDGRGGPGGGVTPAAAASSPWAFDYLPGGRGGRSTLSPARGFRIHEMERVAPPSSPTSASASAPSRSRRFAFAAAGAFSLAALAIGGALGSGGAGSAPVAAGDNTSAGPVRSASSGSAADRDARRRGAGGEKSERTGSLSDSATSGASVKAERGAPLQQRSPSATPSAPPSSPLQPGNVYPLLRDAVFSPPLVRSSLSTFSSPSVMAAMSSSASGTDVYAGTTVSAVPGRTPVRGGTDPTPVATAAPPQR
ncbi:anti-sigma factor family protein [Streptomyces daliensis]